MYTRLPGPPRRKRGWQRWFPGPVAVLMLLTAGIASAESLYKWVDEQGRVHFGERPPESADTAERLDVTHPPTGARVAGPDEIERSRLSERRMLEAQRREDMRRRAARRRAHNRDGDCDREQPVRGGGVVRITNNCNHRGEALVEIQAQ